MSRDLSLVNNCSSLHFPLAAPLLGVLARDLASGIGADMTRPKCCATSVELAVALLGHYYKTLVKTRVTRNGAHPERRGSAARDLPTAFVSLFRGAILTAKQRGKALSFRTRKQRFQDGEVNADCKARW